jgi:hypothetical protein
MDICPACKQSPKLGWRKATMSPLAPMPCENCDAELSVSWKGYLLSVLPGSVAFLLAYLFLQEDSWLQYGGYGVSVLMVVLGQLYLMPLLVKEDSADAGSS